MSEEEPLSSFRSGAAYFRAAYRGAMTQQERDELFFAVVRDHEALREWCRSQGLIPPKFEMTSAEAADKPWLFNLISDAQMSLGLPEPAESLQAELLLFPKLWDGPR